MTALERAARSVVTRWIEDESLPLSLESALTQELVAAHGHSRCVIVDNDEGVAIAVIEGTKAWTLGAVQRRSMHTLIEQLASECRAQGATQLWSGGPPRWYLRSGLAIGSTEARAFVALRGERMSQHVDLWLDPRDVRALDGAHAAFVFRVQEPEERDEIEQWVRKDFSEAWAHEVRAAFAMGALFVARSNGHVAAFAAHSGHCAASGTFGPLGTRAHLRGRGWGAAVACCTLRDLGARGFTSVCVPWVDESVAAFYARLAPVRSQRPRVLYRMQLAGY